MAENYQEHTLQDDINRLHIALDDLKTEWGAAVLSLDEENVERIAQAAWNQNPDNADIQWDKPELNEYYRNDTRRLIRGAIAYLRQLAGLDEPVEGDS